MRTCALLLPALLGGCSVQPAQPRTVEARGEALTVSDATPIAGTRFVAISIALGTGGGYSSSTAANLRNVVLLDIATGASRRLLPDNNRRIRAIRWLTPEDGAARPAESAAAALEPARWYALEVERPGSGAVDLVAGAIAGGSPATIARGIDGVDFLAIAEPPFATLVAREGGRLSYRRIDLARLREVARTGIAI